MASNVKGKLEIICGSMFSGKTEELIRRIKRAQLAQLKVGIFKPKIDSRYSANHVVSHDKNQIIGKAVSEADEIKKEGMAFDIIAIDEGQFFNNEIVAICETLTLKNKRVIVAGLDMDFEGKPFGPIPQLLAIADSITKLHAICVQCGNDALFTYRNSEVKDQILIGEKEYYKPLCRSCYHQKTKI